MQHLCFCWKSNIVSRYSLDTKMRSILTSILLKYGTTYTTDHAVPYFIESPSNCSILWATGHLRFRQAWLKVKRWGLIIVQCQMQTGCVPAARQSSASLLHGAREAGLIKSFTNISTFMWQESDESIWQLERCWMSSDVINSYFRTRRRESGLIPALHFNSVRMLDCPLKMEDNEHFV